MSNKVKTTFKTVNTEDVNLVSKTGLGCGVDNTGVLGTNEPVKTPIRRHYPSLGCLRIVYIVQK